MRFALVLWGAVLAAQTRDIPFDGSILRADRKADLIAADRRVELKRGTVVFTIADSGAPPVEIVTPNVIVHPYFTGDYKVEVRKSGESVITPMGGDVKVSSPQGVEWVPVGRKMIVRGPAAAPRFRVVTALTGWRWIGAMLQTMAQNSGSSVSADAGSSSTSDDSAPAARQPFPPTESAPASSVGRGASGGESRSGSIPSRGK
jgi:hypothetical protein